MAAVNEGELLLVSPRMPASGHGTHLAYGAWNEAEDVLADAAGVRVGIIDRQSSDRSIQLRRVVGRGVRRIAGRTRLLPPTADLSALGDATHVLFMARGPWDLPLLERLRPLRSREVSVSVWMPEIWPSELDDVRLRFESYAMVDHVFVGIDEAVEPLHHIAPDADIHVLPPATDVPRFLPEEADQPRPIAVLGIGRRNPVQHNEILNWARQKHELYLYDTIKGAAIDWQQHRDALANWYQHANVSICNYAKHDVPAEIAGLRVLPGRLFEGLAGGSVLIGMPPDDERQQRVLGGSVVESVDGGANEMIDALERFSDPNEAGRARLRNMALACRGHDWGHRWQSALDALGLKTPEGLQHRLDQLEVRATEFERLSVTY